MEAGETVLLKAFSFSRRWGCKDRFAKRTAKRWRLPMLNWPEMLHHAEDWANGFWTGAASALIMGTAATAVALISHAI